MSDGTLQGAQSSGASDLSPKVDPRDVADIDRELEAYLKEKQPDRSVGHSYSVEEQLSRIKEKAGDRLAKRTPPIKEKETTQTEDIPARVAPEPPRSSSHEDLIRSLEEKYSSGKETGPQNKKEVVLNEEKAERTTLPSRNQADPRKNTLSESRPPQKEISTPRAEAVEPELGTTRSRSALADLKESIEPRDKDKVTELLSQAEKLSHEDQESLIKAFLPRFRRNKERKELFERTQVELERELQSFINKRTTDNSLKESKPTVTSEMNKVEPEEGSLAQAPVRERATHELREEKAQSNPSRDPSASAQKKQFDILDEQRMAKESTHKVNEETKPTAVYDPFMQYGKQNNKEAEGAVDQVGPRVVDDTEVREAPASSAPSVVPASSNLEETNVEASDQVSAEDEIIERYKRHLETSDKKPTVLLYDPSQGFVRKAVDPNDPSLNLSYSIDEAAGLMVLQVFDANGAMLSEIRTALSEF